MILLLEAYLEVSAYPAVTAYQAAFEAYHRLQPWPKAYLEEASSSLEAFEASIHSAASTSLLSSYLPSLEVDPSFRE